jgi:hypothetical protein
MSDWPPPSAHPPSSSPQFPPAAVLAFQHLSTHEDLPSKNGWFINGIYKWWLMMVNGG